MTRRQRKAARYAAMVRARNYNLRFAMACDAVVRMKNVWISNQLALELIEIAALRIANLMSEKEIGLCRYQ